MLEHVGESGTAGHLSGRTDVECLGDGNYRVGSIDVEQNLQAVFELVLLVVDVEIRVTADDTAKCEQ